jgi:hypothetical protein
MGRRPISSIDVLLCVVLELPKARAFPTTTRYLNTTRTPVGFHKGQADRGAMSDDRIGSGTGHRLGGAIEIVPFTKTPRDSVAVVEDEHSSEEFDFTPVTRTRTASVQDARACNDFARIELAYIQLKESGYFKGPELTQLGIDRKVVNYVRPGSSWTFLHQAAFWNHDTAIEWLLVNGSNANAKDRDGKTPADVARERANDRALSMLRVATASAAAGGRCDTVGR